jgi:hypothetical protein
MGKKHCHTATEPTLKLTLTIREQNASLYNEKPQSGSQRLS